MKKLLTISLLIPIAIGISFSVSTPCKAQNPTLYGMTYDGGQYGFGNLFEVTPNPVTYTNTLSFEGAGSPDSARNPYFSHLIEAFDGNLYGMTMYGGVPSEYGNIYKYNPNTSAYTNLVSFTGQAGSFNGYYPFGSLIQALDSNLYGMTESGGNGDGNIFKYNPYTGVYTDLVDFTGTSGAYVGMEPRGNLIQAYDSCLYGMTLSGGINGINGGVMFKYDPYTNVYDTLLSFTGPHGAHPGRDPEGGLVEASDSTLYGMTTQGGTLFGGSLFKYVIKTKTFTSLFNFSGTSGAYRGFGPEGSLIQASDGKLYGMTNNGTTTDLDYGNLFSYDPGTNTYDTLFSFTDQAGAYEGAIPTGTLMQASDGKLYGMTEEGGKFNYGNIFQFDINTLTYDTLLSFTGAGFGPYVGANPYGDLVEYIPHLSATASVVSNVSCNGGSNGNAQAYPSGGTTPYTYSWSPGGNIVVSTSNPTGSVLSATSYTVTISDNKGKTATALVNITQPAMLRDSIADSVNVLCYGNNTGSATVGVKGGTTPYTYLWNDALSQTTAVASGLSSGTYTVTVYDANNCSTTTPATITTPAALTAGANATANTTECTSVGIAGSAPTGGTTPYTYLWTDGSSQTTAVASGLSAGTYTVTVYDVNNCSATAPIIITAPAALVANANTTANTTECSNVGIAGSVPTGGTSPYTYLWTPSAETTSVITDLSAGTYTVTVHDANNCSTTAPAIITAPAALNATTYVVDSTAGNSVAATTPSGGITPYTYVWAPGAATTDTIKGLSAGTYTCAITDANDCPKTVSITIVPTGINSIPSNSGVITIYPNPNNGMFILVFSHAELVSASQPIIEVYNVLGQSVYNATLKQVQGDNAIDLTSQPSGLYLYRVIIQDGNLLGQGKIIIQK